MLQLSQLYLEVSICYFWSRITWPLFLLSVNYLRICWTSYDLWWSSSQCFSSVYRAPFNNTGKIMSSEVLIFVRMTVIFGTATNHDRFSWNIRFSHLVITFLELLGKKYLSMFFFLMLISELHQVTNGSQWKNSHSALLGCV